MSSQTKTILDILLETNRITQTEASNIPIDLSNLEIEEILRQKNLVSSDDITKAYSIALDLPLIRFTDLNIDKENFNFIAKDLQEKYKLIPFEKIGGIPGAKIKIATAFPAEFVNQKNTIADQLKAEKNIVSEFFVTTIEDYNKIMQHFHLKDEISGFEINKDAKKDEQVIEVKMEPQEGKFQKEELQKTEMPKIENQLKINNFTGMKTIDLKSIKIPYEVISKFPIEVSSKYNIVVFANPAPKVVEVAVADPYNPKVKEILDFVREKNEISITEYVAPQSEIRQAINLFYQKPIPINTQEPIIDTNTDTNVKLEKNEPAKSSKIEVTTPSVIENLQNKINKEPQEAKPIIPAQQAPQNKQAINSVIQQGQAVQQQQAQAQVAKKIINIQHKEEKEKTTEDELKQRPPEENLDLFLGLEVKDDATLQKIIQTGDIPRILAAILELAVYRKASDIHIEAQEKDIRIRFRVDGILRDITQMPTSYGPALVSRVKILSHLKIDESRIPQDGRFNVIAFAHEIDLRVSTLPTVFGEKAVLRILDKTQNIFSLEEIGMTGKGLKLVETNITKPYGIILATGPTGSGKSTTLYSILQKISKPQNNVITLEDPVEYEIDGINQCQIKPKIGFTFAEGLRSVLRQDPNVIMVGEIRDAETAGMVTHAALTGHLVLTTLHTNNASSALPRLINMGIEPFLITSSINVIIAQRLVRKLCNKCKQEAKLPDQLLVEISEALKSFNLPKPYKFFDAKGCSECNQGYSGRVGIYEVLDLTDKIEDLAIKLRPASEIAKQAISEGMVTLKQDGLIKAAKGITSVSEILRVAMI